MAEIAFSPSSFDAVLAFWSLIHVHRTEHARVLGHIFDWLLPGGLFAGTLGRTDNPNEHDEYLGAPMYWSHFDTATNVRLLEEAGFDIEEAREIEDAGEMPLWVIARRPVR